MTTGAKPVDNLDDRVVDSCKIRDVPRRCGGRLVSRFERARGLPELQSGKLHGRHSASAQRAHASGELVQSLVGDLHGPGISPSHDEQVWSAD